MSEKDDFSKLKGVSKTIAEQLHKEFASVTTLAMTSANEISRRVGISEAVATRIVKSARDFIGISPITATELLERKKDFRVLTTSSHNLDEIIGGGIQTGIITEFSGAFSTGKTQLMFQLSVNAQKPIDYGGLEGSVYYIDTETTFSPSRILQMASNDENIENPREILNNIYVSRAYSVEHQLKLVKDAEKLIKEKNIKLIIIDSIASHFRTEFGKDELPKRQQTLMRHAEVLLKFAESYQAAVVVTNQVLANIDALFGSSVEPALGYAWGHRPTHRIFLRKSKGSARIAKIFDSPDYPERECVFYISPHGIRDKPEFE